MDSQTKILIQTKFLAFAMKAFAELNKGRNLGQDKYLKYLAEALTNVAAGKTKRLVISMPPRHGKTFMGSICLSAWILAHNPSAKILVLSYGQALADKIAYGIRAIMQSDWFQQGFRTRLAKTKVTDFVTTDGGVVRSLSIEGGVTGLGADFIIIDDPVEIKDCDNSKRLERVNELFDNEIQTRLDDPRKGCIVVIAHRISEDDLPGHVMRKRGWKELKLPLIAWRARSYHLADGDIWHRKKGELLRPDAFGWTDIEERRASKRPGFETLQQQNPGRNSRLRIKAENFPFFSPMELPVLPVLLSIDPGHKGGPGHSFSVIQAWAPHQGAHLLLEQWREQASYRDFRWEARRFIRKYRPSVVLIEGTGQGPALNSDIKPQRGMEMVMVTPIDSKSDRLREHRSSIRRRLVRLPENALWLNEFLEEITVFPYAASDDQVDAMTQYLSWMAKHPTPKRRAPMATAQGTDARGRALRTSAPAPAIQIKGAVLQLGSRATFNSPFLQPKVGVKY
jgi:predicted phage terminase large subunit-like protein